MFKRLPIGTKIKFLKDMASANLHAANKDETGEITGYKGIEYQYWTKTDASPVIFGTLASEFEIK